MSAVKLVGRKLNVVTRKGTSKETKTQELIIKHLTSKGIIRTESGAEYNVADTYNVGKGLFIAIKGAGKAAAPDNTKKATAAPATAPKAAASGRPPAPAVTADELDGKKVNGVPVEKQIRSKGIVVLQDGQRIELANIVRRGQGFVTAAAKQAAPEAKANTSATKGGAVAKNKAPKTSAVSALFSEPGLLTTRAIRGQDISIDGEHQTVSNTYKSGRCVTAEGSNFNIDDVRTSLVDGGFAVISDEYAAELEELHAAAQKGNEPKSAAITRAAVKGQTLKVGKVDHVVTRTFKNNTVETDRGFKCSVAEIAREGANFVYTGKDLPRTGTAVPRNRTAPTPTVKTLDVEAFDYDTTLDLRDHLRESVLVALKEVYNIDMVSVTATQNGSNMATVTFAFAATGANKADIARKVKALENGFAQQQAEQGHDFGSHELIEQEEEDEEPESFDAENDVDHDTDVEDEDEEDEEPESFDDEEEDEEDEEDEEPESFDEEEEETTFPLDTTELVDNAKARLEKLMPGRNLTAYVKMWYATQEVFDVIGYDIEPGHTVDIDGKKYTLVGLDKNGMPLLVNAAGTARPKETLEALHAYVQAGE